MSNVAHCVAFATLCMLLVFLALGTYMYAHQLCGCHIHVHARIYATYMFVDVAWQGPAIACETKRPRSLARLTPLPLHTHLPLHTLIAHTYHTHTFTHSHGTHIPLHVFPLVASTLLALRSDLKTRADDFGIEIKKHWLCVRTHTFSTRASEALVASIQVRR